MSSEVSSSKLPEETIHQELSVSNESENMAGSKKITEEESSEKKEEVSFLKSKEGQKKESKNLLEDFFTSFSEQADSGAKLSLAIDFMESTLSMGESPHFRNFWEARRLALPLFKENISPPQRVQLWAKFSDLSKEARRLKEILDEQSAFAIEQIEIAITALEQEIAKLNESKESFLLSGLLPSLLSEKLVFPKFLQEKESFYQENQQVLHFLNAKASRINALRKELLKTEMRIRQKNQFFQRLSSAGDLVFPKRKELIKELSQTFTQDVEAFIKTHFAQKENRAMLFFLREEIKLMQGLAKALTLNTHCFTQTRMQLSHCWDQVKNEERERKKERAEKKVLFKQNKELMQKEIEQLHLLVEKGEGEAREWNLFADKILQKMRAVQLGREEVKELKEELQKTRAMIEQQLKKEENSRFAKAEELRLEKRANYLAQKDSIQQLITQSDSLDLDTLLKEKERISQQIQSTSFTKIEKQELEKLLKSIKEILIEKQEKALLNLSNDDRQSLVQLQELLKQRKTRKQEIKVRIEELRKLNGSSSLDFAKAMEYTAQLTEEKERLEKVNQGIIAVEAQINELKVKISA